MDMEAESVRGLASHCDWLIAFEGVA